MNHQMSGSTSSTLGSVLLNSRPTTSANGNNETRDAGAFRDALSDAARARVDKQRSSSARPANRPEDKPVQAKPHDAAPSAATVAQGKSTKPSSAVAEKNPAVQTGSDVETTDQVAIGLAEASGLTTALALEGSPVGNETETSDLSDETDERVAELAPSVLAPLDQTEVVDPVAAMAIPGNPLPPLASADPLASAQARVPGGAASPLSSAMMEKTPLSLTPDGTGEESSDMLLDGEGNLSTEDFKPFLSRLQTNQLANGKDEPSLNLEQGLAKSVSQPPITGAEQPQRSLENHAAAHRSFIVQTGVPVGMGQPRWGQAVGERVLWLAAQNVSAAELRLDPPELGPLQVRVSIHQDQASVSFSSPHPHVREALDQNATRLREMFNEQGLHLSNMDVSDQAFGRHQAQDEDTADGSGAGDADTADDDVQASTTPISHLRLVDHYA